MPRYYPAFIDVRDRDCIVIGGGDMGEEKALKLLECGARVTVISPSVTSKREGFGEPGPTDLDTKTLPARRP